MTDAMWKSLDAWLHRHGAPSAVGESLQVRAMWADAWIGGEKSRDAEVLGLIHTIADCYELIAVIRKELDKLQEQIDALTEAP